jgi:prophage regulatory protein
MIYQLEAEKQFPPRIRLGLRAVGWIEGEVQEWLAIRIERSRGSFSDSSKLKHQ